MTIEDVSPLKEIGWYLDNSVFHEFIRQNIRVGFNNSEEADDHTILHIKGNISGTYVPVLGNGKRYAFLLNASINVLRNIQSSHDLTFYYSELTKAEIFRSLRKAHANESKENIENWWDMFIFLMRKYQKAPLDLRTTDELTELALNFPIKKNVQDYIHLITAKKNQLAFITSDKLDGQIEELQSNFYPHIYLWSDVKNKIRTENEFNHFIE